MKSIIISCSLFLAALLCPISQLAAQSPGFYVDGKFLYDRCGEKTILRGTDVMTAWWDYGGATTFPELAKTGANCARIFWQTGQSYLSPAHLDFVITNCINNDMIPMVGLWNATGDWSQLQTCVDYWTSPAIVAVVQEHEQYFLLNIANEAGDGSISDANFRAGYENAITQIRNAGIICPLVIDPAGYGRGENYIFNNAQYLIDFDPLHNLIFDWHPWDAVPEGGSKQRIKTAVDTANSLNICFIIGEFADKGVDISRRTEWEYIMQYTVENDVGYLPWVWWCCGTPAGGHSLVYDKIYGHWNLPWGEEVAIKSPYSIAATAVRPASIVNGSCGPPVYTARKPLPVDDANTVNRNINLHWFAGHGATSNDVYFGADPNAVAAADHSSWEFRGNQPPTTFFGLGTLPYNTTYYWAIDSVNDVAGYAGDVWQFITGRFDPNVTYDRADNDYKAYSSSSLSFNHTLGAGDNRVVVVGIAAEDESAANLNINYVTYNGVNMTPVPGSTAVVGTTMLQRTDLYYILESQLPQPGTYNVYVKRAGSCNESGGGAISLFNVAQQPPEAVAVNSNLGQYSISTNIATLSNNALIVDVVGCGERGEFWAASTGMLRRWVREGGYGEPNSSSAASMTPAAAPGLKTITWNHPDNYNQNERRIAHSVAAFANADVTYRLGDLNRDHAVDQLDVAMFATQWLTAGPEADLDGSTNVDFIDFALMGLDWRL